MTKPKPIFIVMYSSHIKHHIELVQCLYHRGHCVLDVLIFLITLYISMHSKFPQSIVRLSAPNPLVTEDQLSKSVNQLADMRAQ